MHHPILSFPEVVNQQYPPTQRYREMSIEDLLLENRIRITSYNVCYTKLLRVLTELSSISAIFSFRLIPSLIRANILNS